jgi:hypothetical protein
MTSPTTQENTMNGMFGSPDFARFVARRTIQDRITDARARTTRRQNKRAGHGPRRHHVT